MDGHMSMSDHYIFAPDGSVSDLKASSDPFTGELKSCPVCRSPLRNINRYGRIVRRGLLDESTKKFITWANAQFYPLTERMHVEEHNLRERDDEHSAFRQRGEGLNRATLASAARRSIRLEGSRSQQITAILELGPRIRSRYKAVTSLRREISHFLRKVSESEQPFGRIYEMVTDLRRRHSITSTMEYPSQVLQVRNRLLATVLAIRCDFAILSDFLEFKRKLSSRGTFQLPEAWITADVYLNLGANLKECEEMVAEAITRNQPMHQVEGHLYFARFSALERANIETKDNSLLNKAEDHLQQARSVCEAFPSQTAGMLEEIISVETMLHDGVSYTTITNEEKRQIYAAMASEFSGTGHWYRCVNGHPFTIGECGMAMQVSNCPQCGAPVGERDHQTVQGVTAAGDIEMEFGQMRF
ncbi:MAG: hypothetical protein M1812_006719 [Candelaria pacifica]|nr:MAG: hypothetical protein M1812_006719 [Candelaria pacifica]